MRKPKPPEETHATTPPIDLPLTIKRRLDHLILDQTFAVELGITVTQFMDNIVLYYRDIPSIAQVVGTWRRLPAKTKATITFAQLCEKSCISAREMFMVLSGFCYDSGYDKAKRLIGLNIPSVVEQAITNALGQGILSQEERREWMKAWGFFTVPKGADTRIEVHAHAHAAASAEASGLPSFEDTISADEDDYQFRRQLPASSPAIDLPDFMTANSTRVPSRDSGSEHPGVREEAGLPSDPSHD